MMIETVKHDKHIDLLVLTVNIQENISFGVPHVRTTVDQYLEEDGKMSLPHGCGSR